MTETASLGVAQTGARRPNRVPAYCLWSGEILGKGILNHSAIAMTPPGCAQGARAPSNRGPHVAGWFPDLISQPPKEKDRHWQVPVLVGG
jgi:hypothetical protein